MAGWGNFLGKIAEWFPGRKESKQNQIERLIDENYRLQQEYPMSDRTADRIARNIERIKRLRSEISNIA